MSPSGFQAQARILIADNDAVSQRLFAAIYSKSEFEIEFCNTAAQVISILKERQIDLLITEIVLPDNNGFELRKRVRLFKNDLPVIFVSAIVDSGTRKLQENLSNDPDTFFLRKPVLKSAMLELTRRVISGSQERKVHQHYFEQLQSDLFLASKMQQLMLPDWINVEANDFYMVANYMPHSHLSGDYFDLVRMNDGRLFFVIGDISGHGIKAALHMSVIQSLTNVFIRNTKPGNIICDYLNELNRQICVDFDSVFYLTCLAAIIDPQTHKIEYLNAGHPGFFTFSGRNGHLHYLGNASGSNIPVGWIQDHQYKKEDLVTCDFPDDCIFMAVTDGVMERSNSEGQMLGLEGLAQAAPQDDLRMLLPFTLEENLGSRGYNIVQDDMLIVSLGFATRTPAMLYKCLKAIPQSMAQAGTLAKNAAEEIERYLHKKTVAYKAELAIGEFLNNIIVHALDGAMKMTPKILFRMIVYSDKVELTFIDQGKEWSYVPQKRGFDEDLEEDFYSLAQAGRGMRIIEDIVSEITRHRIGALNITRFILLAAESDDR